MTYTITNQRLKFIDAARSVAILLMLEGHFISLTLDKSSFDNDSTIYLIWSYIRGFTAPMFFTVSGIIFVYLLSNNKNKSFFSIIRVKKGFKRSIELLIWGYLLQANILNYNKYITLNVNSWFFAFHVLQCIGIGIIIIILVFGLFKLIKLGKLYAYYIITGTIVFLLYSLLKNLPSDIYFPNSTHEIFQNMIKGPHSLFPIIPWVGFVLYGGAIGALLYDYKHHVNLKWFSILLILCGISLNFIPWSILKRLDLIFDTSLVLIKGLLKRLGDVLIVIGILMSLEKYFKSSNSLFLKIGQNTLPIYIIHVMILYSGFFGIGLNRILKNNLTPFESVFGAICFIVFFVVLAKNYNHIEYLWHKIKSCIYKDTGKNRV